MPNNAVIAIISSVSPLQPETEAAFSDIMDFGNYPKSTHLLEIGKVARNMYFIRKGLARVYYVRNDLDVTDYFAVDNQFIGGVPSLFTGRPSEKAIELLEDSEIYSFKYAKFDALCAQHPDLERAARKLAIYAMLEEQERIESIRFLSVKERYDQLERKYPGITNRAPLKYIASYLSTSNVSISRIRAGKQ